MIVVSVILDEQKYLKSVKASGHAGLSLEGTDIVCAAATTLLRSVYSLVLLQEDIKAEGRAESRGNLELALMFVPAERQAWLKGITDFLLLGLGQLQQEYPKNIEIKIRKV